MAAWAVTLTLYQPGGAGFRGRDQPVVALGIDGADGNVLRHVAVGRIRVKRHGAGVERSAVQSHVSGDGDRARRWYGGCSRWR